jgi:ABC-type Fe3+-hydroxamate transport system substrate-binding protein
MCDMGPTRAIAIAASSCVLVAACSSAGHPAVPVSSSSSSSDAVQQYLTAVDTLCDGLEQKIIALNGGQFDIPLKDFLAQLPQHTKLRDDFDRQLAAIAVPQAAAPKAQALATYVAFANKLDAARLRAARQGAAAYQREIDAEKKSAASDPSIAAMDAAGFSQSCQAR